MGTSLRCKRFGVDGRRQARQKNKVGLLHARGATFIAAPVGGPVGS